MASHPYISGPRNITQMITFLRRNFPATVNADTVKKLSIASNNESYVINVLQFLGIIDENGKRTDLGHEVMTKHNEGEFQSSFADLVKTAYADLFDLRADEAWTMSRDELIAYFRSVDKTSDIIGGRQAAVFVVLKELAGFEVTDSSSPRAQSKSNTKTKATGKKPKPAEQRVDNISVQTAPNSPVSQPKGEMALTVRIEINLPAEGTQETYDAIFKSIKANLFP